MGNCLSQLKKSKVSPEGKPVTSSPAKNKSHRFSFFGRKNTNNGKNDSNCQVEVPAATSKHEVAEACETTTNTSDGPTLKKRPLSTSTFIVPYENSLLHQNQQLRESSSSEVTLVSSSTPWPTSDASSEAGSVASSFLSDHDVVKPEPKRTNVSEESCESDEDDDQSRNCARTDHNVVVHKPRRPKKNIWRMPVYTDPLIVGDGRKTKTALETWTVEVDKLLLGDACAADLLLYELDEIIPAGQDRAGYRCELPRPKTRRGRATVPSQVGPLNKAVPADKENIIKNLQPEGGNKQQQVSIDRVRAVRDKSTAVAVKKCVRFVDVPTDTQSLAKHVSDGPEQDNLDERITAPENLAVYDEAELELIDEIEKNFGIT